MFRKISLLIALQFTAFVFLLFLINGMIFLAVDIGNARRETQYRLLRTSQVVLDRADFTMESVPKLLSPALRDRVRVVNPRGTPLYVGGMLMNIPFSDEQFVRMTMENDEIAIYTTPIIRQDRVIGYLQVAERARATFRELPARMYVYFLVSVVISGLTFLVGLFFARRSLKPAEESMKRLEQFTQDASHELRTPLAALTSSLDLALKTKNYREGIESAKEDVEQIATLTERLLELARLDQLNIQKESVNLSNLVENAVEKNRALAEEKHLTVTTSIAENITVKGDPALLRQLVTNLFSNAIKFSKPEGGTITAKLAKNALSIADTGVGIAPKDLSNIFDRFFQAEASRANGGLGLGLALVKRIVDLHGFHITTKSELGIGTTFTIVF